VLNRSEVRVRRILLHLAAAAFFSVTSLAQQRPLQTDDASILPLGHIRAQFGVEFLQKQRYPITGLEGDLTRIGVIGVHVGVGEYAEFQISGVAQDFLSVSRRFPAPFSPGFSGNSTSDFGDLSLATKLRLAGEEGRRPAMAFKFGVELPNASRDKGLGIDETRFHAAVLASKQVGKARLLGSVGFGILPSPVVRGKQADPLEFGLGFSYALLSRLSLVGEIEGRQGPHREGNENQARVRGGVRFEAGGIHWDVAAVAGMREFDADSGVVIGARWEFQGFGRARKPITIK
jgi:hypothetical protein